MVEAVYSSETFVHTYQIIRCHDPEHSEMNLHLCENLNPLSTFIFDFPTQHKCGKVKLTDMNTVTTKHALL